MTVKWVLPMYPLLGGLLTNALTVPQYNRVVTVTISLFCGDISPKIPKIGGYINWSRRYYFIYGPLNYYFVCINKRFKVDIVLISGAL